MANILWNKLPEENKEEYVNLLKIFGALSGLNSDENVKKFLGYPICTIEIKKKVFHVRLM